MNNPIFPNTPPVTAIDSILDIHGHQRGLISRTYISISKLLETTLDMIKRDWEDELGSPLANDEWQESLTIVNGSTSCARLSLIQFKVIHRIYFTNSKLHSKIYANVSDACNRCNLSPTNKTHMFWSCPCLFDYLKNI